MTNYNRDNTFSGIENGDELPNKMKIDKLRCTKIIGISPGQEKKNETDELCDDDEPI